MSTELWLRANALIEQALQLPVAGRAAWLDQACAGQPALRSEVERRLAADAAAGSAGFLEKPLMPSLRLPETKQNVRVEAAPQAGAPSAEGPTPQRLGPYRILHEIGQGGMGTVYAAERDDDTFHRLVAIKVITAGRGDTDVARRLRAERHILARLEHPGIGRIYDGGTMPDGRPYFVMEHIAGLPIDTFCHRRNLSIKQRVALVEQVCHSVEYAHRNLVVHRDLKPSNILVTESGEAKLLDFGVAKVLEADGEPSAAGDVTMPWRQHLTLNYASPEQLRGQPVSTASDVYALGVLLFRLLTGQLPRTLNGLSPWEAEQQLTTREVSTPSSVVRQGATAGTESAARNPITARRLVGDLDAIVLKALRTDPDARYGSAGQLADDLRRYRAGLPVDARRGSVRYRIGKHLRRHRLATAAVLVALLLGTAFVTSVLVSARRLARSHAQLVIEQTTQRHTLDFLLGLFEDAGPYAAEGIELSVREVVDRQTARLDTTLRDQPAVRSNLLSTLGWVYLDLGATEQAEEFHTAALELRRGLDESSAEVAESLDGMAAALREQSQLDRADQLSAKALEHHRRHDPSDPEALLRSLNQRVNLLCKRDEWKRADPLSSEALALARVRDDSVDTQHATALIQRALVLRNTGDLELARQLYFEAERQFAKRFGAEHPVFAALYNNLGRLESQLGRAAVAADYYLRADAQFASAFGEDFYDRVIPLTNAGRKLHEIGDLKGAERALRAAIQVAVRSPAIKSEHEIGYYGRPAVALGAMLAATGRCREVLTLLGDRVASWTERSDNRIVHKARELVTRCQDPEQKVEND